MGYRFYLGVLVLVLWTGADIGLASAGPTPGVKVQGIDGEVELIRKNRSSNLKGEAFLLKGDVIRTGRVGKAVLKFKNGSVQLGSNTTFRLDEIIQNGNLGRGALVYGNFIADLDGGALEFPRSVLKVKKGQFFLHVFPSEMEFSRSLVGLKKEGPSLLDTEKLKQLSSFVQISCLSGEAELKSNKGGDSLRIRDEEMARIISGIPDPVTKRVEKSAMKAHVRSLGF